MENIIRVKGNSLIYLLSFGWQSVFKENLTLAQTFFQKKRETIANPQKFVRFLERLEKNFEMLASITPIDFQK